MKYGYEVYEYAIVVVLIFHSYLTIVHSSDSCLYYFVAVERQCANCALLPSFCRSKPPSRTLLQKQRRTKTRLQKTNWVIAMTAA